MKKQAKINQKNENNFSDLNHEIQLLKQEMDEYKNETNHIIDSYQDQFNTLFLNFNLEPKGVLKYSQLFCQEILDFVVNVCKKII